MGGAVRRRTLFLRKTKARHCGQTPKNKRVTRFSSGRCQLTAPLSHSESHPCTAYRCNSLGITSLRKNTPGGGAGCAPSAAPLNSEFRHSVGNPQEPACDLCFALCS